MENNVRGAITASILKSNEVWPEFSGKKLEFVTPVESILRGCSSSGDLYWVKIGGLWGLYDFEKSDFAVPLKYRQVRSLIGVMFRVWEDERRGIFDTDTLEVTWGN